MLQKRQKPAVEITVVFSDAFARNTANSNMSRYFYERKNTLEEKQRQEYGSVSGQTDPAFLAQSAQGLPGFDSQQHRAAQQILMQQLQQNAVAASAQGPHETSMPAPAHQVYTNQHQLNMHVHAGTGGHFTSAVNLNEDCSSSFSSSSKRHQRVDEVDMRYRNLQMLNILNNMPLVSQSVQIVSSNQVGGQPRRRSAHQEELCPVPPPQMRCTSEECASIENLNEHHPESESQKMNGERIGAAVADKHDEDAEEEKPAHQQLRDQESDQHNSSEYEEQMNEIQRVIELTRQLQRDQRGAGKSSGGAAQASEGDGERDSQDKGTGRLATTTTAQIQECPSHA